ncbi:hypothetical protein MTO96_038876 [Rhipicephalus appendiculatus]
MRRKRSAGAHNNKSGNSPCDVPYEDDIAKIRWLGDSLEPEEVRVQLWYYCCENIAQPSVHQPILHQPMVDEPGAGKQRFDVPGVDQRNNKGT